MAIGTPMPASRPEPIRAIERGARVRSGWPLRRILPARRRPDRHAPLTSPRQPPPLVLLISAREALVQGDVRGALVEAVSRFAVPEGGGLLLDLTPSADGLWREEIRPGDSESLSEVLDFGIPIEDAARVTKSGLRLVAVDAPPPPPDRLLSHPGWARLVRRLRTGARTLFVHLPAEAGGLASLAEQARGAVMLETVDADESLRAELPPGLEVLATIPVAPLPRPDPGYSGGVDEPIAGVTPFDEQTAEPLPAAAQEEPAGVNMPPPPPPELEPPRSPTTEQWPRSPAERLPATPVPRYTAPRTSARRERFIHVAAVVILAYWSYYIFWRWTATLNPDALWFAVPLALAETWGWLTGIFLVVTVWRLNHRTPPPVQHGLSVDVFITTYDEPLEVIRRTTVSAREIGYPHRTYVLDDGRRDEVRAMAEELGVGYLTRPDNRHAKAGNLNHALQHTSGDFILQLDADHAPLPHILDRLLGFFDDPRVAFVQTPQDFYNLDSFTADVDEEARRIWEEQKLFFSVVQPGKDSWNAAFFCGSCGVIRRTALEGIGGFSTESVTEDIETSLLLHSRGWRSVYHGETLAYGLAAPSAAAFHIQHGRWARGAMQVLRRFNPLTLPGLTAAQRIGYFYSLSSYLSGVQKSIFYASPAVFFFTGVLPIRALDAEFLLRFVPYLVLSIVLLELLARGRGFTWIAERYQMAKFWTYTRAIGAFFTRRPLKFEVTPKVGGTVRAGTYMPQLLLMVITVTSVYWAIFAYPRGWVVYGVPGWSSLAFQLNFLWAAINVVLAAYVVRMSVRLQNRGRDHRFSDHLPISLRVDGATHDADGDFLGVTDDLNATGLSFRSVARLAAGTDVEITVPLSTREVVVRGAIEDVRRAPSVGTAVWLHDLALREMPVEVRTAIEIHCTHHAVPFKQLQYHSSGRLFGSPEDRPAETPRDPRHLIRLPIVMTGLEGAAPGSRRELGVLEELTPTAARLITSEPAPPGTIVTFEVPGTALHGRGPSILSRALHTPLGVRFLVTIHLDEVARERPATAPEQVLSTTRK
jgi:cellulose synthase/poly-beta-1,6-N-acetylglucosamine synthase-like glycosyltransferase